MAAVSGPFDWVIRFVVVSLLIFTISCILLQPLWKLTKSRPSLIIVFSRAIGNCLRLVSYMPTLFVYSIFNIEMTPDKSYYLAYAYSLNTFLVIVKTSAHVHNLALAVNRSHAMFFPFHYNMVFAKKKNIYVLCLCLWLICFCVSCPDYFLLTKFAFSPTSQLSKYCMYTSGLFYAALGCRLLRIRYKSSSMNGASTEKDAIKILVVCFSCLAMSALNQLVFIPFAQYANANFSDSARFAVYWGSYVTEWLILCTEEICLALLVRDFRRNVMQQIRSVFCCCRCSSAESNKNSINNIATKVTTVRPLPMVV